MSKDIKPFFIKCSVSDYRYLTYDETNNPVNIALCKSIKKCKHAYYPDNDGMPAISFIGCDTKWAYKTEDERDADFDRITNNEALNEK